MRRPEYETGPVAPQRLQALADGVFAIAMTLLVFQLAIPSAAEADERGGLAEAMGRMWPELLLYALSFLVLGMFWLIHHVLFDHVERYDSTLVWLNIAYLLVVALVPYATALFGEHGPETVTALLYGGIMLAAFDLGWAIHAYTKCGRRLVSADYDLRLVRGGMVMGWIYTAVMVVPLAAAFVSPTTSFVLYGMIVVAFIAFTLLGRWEVVMVWPSERGDGQGDRPVGVIHRS